MKRFYVTGTIRGQWSHIVEAETKELAIKIVEDMIDSEDYDPDLETYDDISVDYAYEQVQVR